MPSNAPRKPSSVPWPVMAVVVLVLLAVIAWLLVRPGGTEQATPSTSSAPAPPTTTAGPTGEQTSSGNGPQGVDGCLGGRDPSVAIYAALKAPLTRVGAVSFLATVERWVALWPKPSGQLDQLGPKIFDKESLQRMEAARPPKGAKRWADTTDSAYQIRSFSKKETTIAFAVDSMAKYQGQKSSAANAAVFNLSARDGHWTVASATGLATSGKDASTAIAQFKKTHARLPGGCS